MKFIIASALIACAICCSCQKSKVKMNYHISGERNSVGIVDDDSNFVVPPVYTSVFRARFVNFFVLNNDSSWHYFSINAGKYVGDSVYKVFPIASMIDRLALVCQDTQTILCDSMLNVICKMKNTHVEPFSYNYILFYGPDSLKGLVDKNGNIVLSNIFDDITMNEMNAWYMRFEKISFDLWSEKIHPDSSFEPFYNRDYVFAKYRGKYGVYDPEFRLTVPFKYDEILDYYFNVLLVRNGSKYGFINLAGKPLTPIEFDSVGDIESEFYWNTLGDIYRCFDIFRDCRRDELYATQNSYFEKKGYSEGLIRVKKNWKWGYIDTRGKTVIPFEYEEVSNFKNSKARVKKNGHRILIDKQGRRLTADT